MRSWIEGFPIRSFRAGTSFYHARCRAGLPAGLTQIVGGMCQTDYSRYSDCRDDALKALQVALNLGMDARFVLHTPLMWLTKTATWTLADEIAGRSWSR